MIYCGSAGADSRCYIFHYQGDCGMHNSVFNFQVNTALSIPLHGDNHNNQTGINMPIKVICSQTYCDRHPCIIEEPHLITIKHDQFSCSEREAVQTHRAVHWAGPAECWFLPRGDEYLTFLSRARELCVDCPAVHIP